MKEISTIPFVDLESKDEGIAVISAKKGCVGLCLSIIENGDIEVFLAPENAEQVIAALKEGLLAAQTDR